MTNHPQAAIRVTDSFIRHISYAVYADARGARVDILETIGSFDLDEDISNLDVLTHPVIGGRRGVYGTALLPLQSVALLELQQARKHERLLDNVVSPRNRGFMFGDNGQLYEVRMDSFHPRVIHEEFTLDACTLEEMTWHKGSRIFYNKAPRSWANYLPWAKLSMSMAHEILTGVRSDVHDPMTGEFPLLAHAA